MTQDGTHARIIQAKRAARLSRLGSLAGALGVVALALGAVAIVTGRPVLGGIAMILAAVLFVLTVVGVRLNARVRHDPAVQQRTSRLRRARYRSAYPAHGGEDRATGA